jgi:fructose-specific component phosphotransferase system IIB-like protein
MLIDLAVAKAHLNVTVDLDDADITLKLEAAEQSAIEFIGRNVYADHDALTAAQDDVLVTLAAASAAYLTATAAAASIANGVDKDMALLGATEAYTQAQTAARRTYQGIVVSSNIKAAILLICGHLYANREDVVVSTHVAALPMGAHSLLQPYRVGMGI